MSMMEIQSNTMCMRGRTVERTPPMHMALTTVYGPALSLLLSCLIGGLMMVVQRVSPVRGAGGLTWLQMGEILR